MDKEHTTLRSTKPGALGGIAPVAHTLRGALVLAQRMELPDNLARAWQQSARVRTLDMSIELKILTGTPVPCASDRLSRSNMSLAWFSDGIEVYW
jgi:hypothetical protein